MPVGSGDWLDLTDETDDCHLIGNIVADRLIGQELLQRDAYLSRLPFYKRLRIRLCDMPHQIRSLYYRGRSLLLLALREPAITKRERLALTLGALVSTLLPGRAWGRSLYLQRTVLRVRSYSQQSAAAGAGCLTMQSTGASFRRPRISLADLLFSYRDNVCDVVRSNEKC